MALLGQASGAWTESSSSLRILHVGKRNSVGILTDDAFTQTNPPIVTAAATISQCPGLALRRLKNGVLGGSVTFARPDIGENYVGGPAEGVAPAYLQTFLKPLGVFINDAAGNPYENLPAQASGKGPYVSSQGTYANQLFETQILDGAVVNFNAGDPITYFTGVELIASRNGYLMPKNVVDGGGALQNNDLPTTAAESAYAAAASSSTTIGILKTPADSEQNEITYDQRI